MKNLAACLLAIFSVGSLFAQKSTYLKAEAGFGRGTVRTSPSAPRIGLWQPVSASRFALSGGVQIKKLSVEIGFGYGRTGGRFAQPVTYTSYNNPEGAPATLKTTQRVSHITLPVSMGYDFRAGKRWAIQPRLGLEGAYTAASRTENVALLNGESLNIDARTATLKPLSLHATGALQLHYRVTPGIEIYGGPSYRHMLTNGAAETLYIQPPYYKLRTTSATFDAGVMFRLNRSSAAPKPSVPVGPQE